MDRLILAMIFLLMLITFGFVTYDQVVKPHGDICHVKDQTLYCPPGVTWAYVALDIPTDAAKGNYP